MHPCGYFWCRRNSGMPPSCSVSLDGFWMFFFHLVIVVDSLTTGAGRSICGEMGVVAPYHQHPRTIGTFQGSIARAGVFLYQRHSRSYHVYSPGVKTSGGAAPAEVAVAV